MEPHEETLLRMLPIEDNYRYQVAIVRQSCLREAWFVINLQLTLLSPPVVISIEQETNTGLLCKGSEDPWDSVPQPTTTAYWVPRALLKNVPNYFHIMLRA